MRTTFVAVLACALALSLAPAGPAFASTSSLDRAVVRAINAQRARHGLRRLRVDRGLDRAALNHSRSMARLDVLTHAPALAARLHPRGRSWSIGETIAWMSRGTHKIASAVVRAWMDSPPHRALLLSGSFRRIGVGSKRGGGGTYFTADLAG